MNVHTRWREAADDARCQAWARDLHKATEPFATGGAYVNFMPADDTGRIGAVYGDNYRRLVEVKRRWDPENRFHMNHNISPA
jgi:hypothetical protein